MKRTIITLSVAAMIFALMSPNNIYAQSITAKGVKVGLNLANISGINIEPELKLKLGYTVGGFIVVGINDNIGIRPEVLYSMRGTKFEWEFWGTIYKGRYNLNYLEIPVLLQYTLTVDGSFKPNLLIGPALGIKLSAKAKVEGGEEEDIMESMKSMDFGVILGAGAVLNNRITFEVRYNIGLSSIEKNVPRNYWIDPYDFKNRVISIILGFSL